MGVQFCQRFVEVELAAKAEAVDRALAVLAEVDLVDIGVEQVYFFEPRFQNYGHGQFPKLAGIGAQVI